MNAAIQNLMRAPQAALAQTRKSLLVVLVGFCALISQSATAKAEQYLSETDFLKQQSQTELLTQALWLTGDLKTITAEVLQHPANKLRQRYWLEGQRSIWVMDEIGKEKPITVGIVVNGGKLETVQVLAFRESRGWEVKYPFFSRQFTDAQLNKGNQLSKNIDNITGATLSVRAVTKLARLALIYHQRVMAKQP